MRKRCSVFLVAAVPALILYSAVGTRLFPQVLAGGSTTRGCPHLVDLQQVKMEVAQIIFVDLVDGAGGTRLRVPDDQRDKFRIAVVTVRVKKPAGMRIEMAAADLTLHYYHGTEVEVAPCEGISAFATVLDIDRQVNLARMPGPGWVKMTTMPRSTQATEVYFDAVFDKVEPDTREVWLCVAQPTTLEPFLCPTPAWRP